MSTSLFEFQSAFNDETICNAFTILYESYDGKPKIIAKIHKVNRIVDTVNSKYQMSV